MNRRVYICTARLGVVILSVLGLAVNSAAQSANNPATWPAAGRDLSNSRNQPVENLINPGNVSSLTTKWVFRTGSDVSATPTVGADAVYVPDWAGNLYAIRKDNGQAIWATRISQYTGAPDAFSRVSPAIHGNDLIVGDIASSGKVHDGARIIAINQQNGALHWVTQVERTPPRSLPDRRWWWETWWW